MVHPSVSSSRPLARWPRIVLRTSDDAAAPKAVPDNLVAGVIPAQILHEHEIVLLVAKPSILFIILTSLRFVVVVGLLAVLTVRVTGVSAVSPITPHQIGIIATLLVLGRLVWALMVWTSHVYLLTNQRVVTIKGVLNVAIFQAPLRKISRTTLYKTLPERLLGLGTLGIATAATTEFDSVWLMIPRPMQTHEQLVAAIHRAG